MTGIHPTIIAQSFQKAASKAVEYLTEMSTPVDLNDKENLLRAASTSLNSKVSGGAIHNTFQWMLNV
jgi:T-complex protein 1 subunit delta